MGKITDIIVDRGSLRAAWDDLQDMGLSEEVVSAIGEVLAADKKMMSARGASGERKSLDPEIRAEIEQTFFIALGDFHHVIEQENFVGGRSNFCGESRIVSGDVRLCFVRQIRMHRVTPFVRQGRHRLVIIVVIEQQIRMYVIGRAVHISAGGFAWP